MEKFFLEAQKEIIKTLYSSNAIKINLDEGFQLKGGIVSPVYCSAGVLENTIDTRGRVVSALFCWVGMNYPKVEAIVGVASGGISWATSIANSKCLPLLRAHSHPKNHGLHNQIDGEIPFDGAKTLVIDDVITSGQSVLNVVKALREGTNGKKADVVAVCSIFDWDFSSVNKRFEEAGVKKYHVTSFNDVLTYGFEHGFLPKEARAKILRFREEQNSL